MNCNLKSEKSCSNTYSELKADCPGLTLVSAVFFMYKQRAYWACSVAGRMTSNIPKALVP